jgi:hypothetical protein
LQIETIPIRRAQRAFAWFVGEFIKFMDNEPGDERIHRSVSQGKNERQWRND